MSEEIDEESQLMIDSFNSMYQTMALLGVDPSRLEMNYRFGDHEDDLVSIALPDNNIAIMTDEDDQEAEKYLVDEGWKVFRLDTADVLRFHGIFGQFLDIVRADKLRTMSHTDKTTSSHEDRLLDEILRRGIPAPDRNYKFFKDTGRELTTPDFTWEDYRIAFFVDGLWWHVAMDDKSRLETLRDPRNEKDLAELNKTRHEKDGENRSVLASRGWMILSCTDRDLDKPEGVRAKASMIAQAMANIDKQRRETKKAVGDLNFSKKAEKLIPAKRQIISTPVSVENKKHVTEKEVPSSNKPNTTIDLGEFL